MTNSTLKLTKEIMVATRTHCTDFENLLIKKALDCATEVHKNQKRVDSEPYMTHVLRVTRSIAIDFQAPRYPLIAAALLHDTVEDHAEVLAERVKKHIGDTRKRAFEYIAHEFSSHVSVIVKGLTNPSFPDDLAREEIYRRYARHITTAIKDPDVCVVKIADFLDNTGNLHLFPKPDSRIRRANKYLPVCNTMIKRLADPDIPLAPAIKHMIGNTLKERKKLLQSIKDSKEG